MPKVTITQPVEPTVTLEMSMSEAEAVMGVLGYLVTSPEPVPDTAAIYTALYDAGVTPLIYEVRTHAGDYVAALELHPK